MADFDAQVWENRAWKRYEASIGQAANPSIKKKLREKLDAEITAIIGIRKIIEWCFAKRTAVNFTNRKPGGLLLADEKIIHINSRQLPEHQLFILLHECGHMLIGSESANPSHRFRLGYPSSFDPEVKGKFIHRCAIVEEEFEAWHRGQKLAAKLNIDINRKNYDSLKTTMLKTYMKWALKSDPY